MDLHELTQNGLMEACRATLPHAPELAYEPEPLQVAAVIGFTSEQLRGTLALATGRRGLRSVGAHLGAPEGLAEDSLGETVNLMAGHVKRTLARFGHVVTISPPLLVRGLTIEVLSKVPYRVEHTHHSGLKSIVAWMDYQTEGEIVLAQTADESIGGGESVFF